MANLFQFCFSATTTRALPTSHADAEVVQPWLEYAWLGHSSEDS